ncbi:MAG: hypothetical protein MUO68_12735, partial [Desulfobacteraceae bacterium]|nr:hypothetical protein [Desulfobacteraceae bacterium]
IAERALGLSANYANTKTHRGKSIGHRFQMTQVKLARMVSKIEAMRAYLFQVCSMVDQGKHVPYCQPFPYTRLCQIYWETPNRKILTKSLRIFLVASVPCLILISEF